MSNIKYIAFIIALLFLLSYSGYSQDDPAKWTYFRVHVYTADAPVFQKVLDELNVTDSLGSYTLVVNISDTTNQYILIGDERDPAVKDNWMKLSEGVRTELLNWTKPNKFKLNK